MCPREHIRDGPQNGAGACICQVDHVQKVTSLCDEATFSRVRGAFASALLVGALQP